MSDSGFLMRTLTILRLRDMLYCFDFAVRAVLISISLNSLLFCLSYLDFDLESCGRTEVGI